MSISITTLNNEAAVAKTFTGRYQGSNGVSEWYNATDSTASLQGDFIIKQQLIGKTRVGVPIRRTLVQSSFTAPTTVVIGGNSVTVPEQIVVNLTITTPTALATLTTTQRKDLVAFIRNFITAANVDKLAAGEC